MYIMTSVAAALATQCKARITLDLIHHIECRVFKLEKVGLRQSGPGKPELSKNSSVSWCACSLGTHVEQNAEKLTVPGVVTVVGVYQG